MTFQPAVQGALYFPPTVTPFLPVSYRKEMSRMWKLLDLNNIPGPGKQQLTANVFFVKTEHIRENPSI